MTVVGRHDVEVRLRALIVALEANTGQLADARGNLKASEQAWRSQAEQTLTAAEATAHQRVTGARKDIEANALEARGRALHVARHAIEESAPACLAADWSDALWLNLPVATPGEWVRVGTGAFGPDRIPIALPLSAGVWMVAASDAQALMALVQNTVTRLLAAFDAPRLRVLAFDPGLTLDLGVFAGIRTVSEASVPPAITSADAFERALERLLADVSAVADRITAAGYSSY